MTGIVAVIISVMQIFYWGLIISYEYPSIDKQKLISKEKPLEHQTIQQIQNTQEQENLIIDNNNDMDNELIEKKIQIDTILDQQYILPEDHEYKYNDIHRLKCQEHRQRNNILYTKNTSYYHSFNFIYEYGDISDYNKTKKIGDGYYSNVYLADSIKENNTQVVIKDLNSIYAGHIRKEYYILKQLKKCKQIVQIRDIYPLYHNDGESEEGKEMDKGLQYVFYKENSTVNKKELKKYNGKYTRGMAAIVFDYSKGDTVHHLAWYKKMDDMDIRIMTYDVLVALSYSQKKNIMHRDVKPGNIIYDTKEKKTLLIDYGIADYFNIDQSYYTRVQTIQYRAPELFLNYTCYDYRIDTWSVGVILGELIFQKVHLFDGKNDDDAFLSIIDHYGTQNLKNIIEKYDVMVDFNFAKLLNQEKPQKLWDESFILEYNYANEDSLDLLNKLLAFDFKDRLYAQDALKHKYFDPVREKYRKEKKKSNKNK